MHLQMLLCETCWPPTCWMSYSWICLHKGRCGLCRSLPKQIWTCEKPIILKANICLFVCLTVKAVHLELVLDLTTESFILALCRFRARQSYPLFIWSDHGTNFIGANHELKELNTLLNHQVTQGAISEFCSTQSIQWKYIITSLWQDMGVSCKGVKPI